jgi:hypothetical protein
LYFGSLNNGFKFVDSSNSPLVTITNGGNVGIGTTNPAWPLHTRATSTGVGFSTSDFVLGATGTVFNIAYGASTGNTYTSLQTTTTGGVVAGNTVLQKDGGNVGIGTTTPGYKLEVNSNTLAEAAFIATGTADSRVVLSTPSNFWQWGVDQSDSSKFKLDYSTGGIAVGGATLLTVQTNGNVGIGKSNPAVALDVVGSINLTGTVNAKYQDVAEWVPSSEQLSAGTVVVLDSTKANQVTSSSVSYDTRVAGVISEQPGLALGEKSEGKVLVATTGRVRVKVDATTNPIHIGDLLVTSDFSGLAMKSEPILIGGRQIHAPGTLIGKALEPLEKGKGTILVLLSLQ